MEFALVLPILLLVLGGIVDYARAYMELQMMTNAAGEGARMAIISTDSTVTDARVEDLVRSFFADGDSADMQVEIAPSLSDAEAGDIVSVRVTRPFEPIFLGFFKWFDPDLGIIPDTLTYAASGRRM